MGFGIPLIPANQLSESCCGVDLNEACTADVDDVWGLCKAFHFSSYQALQSAELQI